MDFQDWNFEDELDILQFWNDSYDNDFTPSPSSIPSLTFSSTPSRPSLSESETNDDPWTTSVAPSVADSRLLQNAGTDNEVEEELEYAYEARASTLNDSYSSRVRNRASGGFFRRLLRRDARTSDDQTMTSESALASDRIIRRGATCSAAFSTPMLQNQGFGIQKNLDSWPLPPASTSPAPARPKQSPESPILGSCSMPLTNETLTLPAAILDSCDFTLDVDSALLAYAPEPSDNSPSGSPHTSGPKVKKVKYLTVASSSHQQPFTAISSPTLPHESSTSPFLLTTKSGDTAACRRSSITHALRLFPSPPSRVAPKATQGKGLVPLTEAAGTEPPTPPQVDFPQHRMICSGSSAVETVAPGSPRLGKERSPLSDDKKKEKLLREHELATYSLRYENTARCWEPFRTLLAADLSLGRAGKTKTGRARRSWLAGK
ncbi:hypothetical protein MMC10_000214 [Thelotrema lepadinum]|nr:hypothetical protein [Thelotrema lepadinum]